MVESNIRKVIVFICLILFVYGCEKHVSISETEETGTLVTDLEKEALDSLFSNNAYSRSLLLGEMMQTTDSLVYYRLMSVYSRACYAAAQYDSVLYYNRIILRYCKKTTPTPRLHDLFSAIYNSTGNVCAQRAFPDSAVLYSQKAYQHHK